MSTIEPRRIVAPHPRSLDEVVGRNLPQWAVDFLVIDLERDLMAGIFLTLKLASTHDSPHVRAMYTVATAFFRRIDELFSKGDRFSLQIAYRMLTFPEPEEIRLGYAAMGSYGSALGEGDLRDYLFAVLREYPDLRRTLAVEPDAISLIPKIGMDRASDIVATITKRQITAFTQEQAAFWKFNPEALEVREVHNAWTPSSEKLESFSTRVPVDDLGRTFLLVPKEICRSGPPMRPGQYLDGFDPDGGSDTGDSAKERMLADAAAHPGRLEAFARERMKDPKRFKPRRELRRTD